MESSWQSIWKGNLLKWQSPRQKAPWRGQEPSGSRANTGTHELVSLTFFGVGQRVRVTFRLAQTGPTLLTTQQNARSCRNGARLKAKFCNAEFFKALSFAGELPKKKKKPARFLCVKAMDASKAKRRAHKLVPTTRCGRPRVPTPHLPPPCEHDGASLTLPRSFFCSSLLVIKTSSQEVRHQNTGCHQAPSLRVWAGRRAVA